MFECNCINASNIFNFACIFKIIDSTHGWSSVSESIVDNFILVWKFVFTQRLHYEPGCGTRSVFKRFPSPWLVVITRLETQSNVPFTNSLRKKSFRRVLRHVKCKQPHSGKCRVLVLRRYLLYHEIFLRACT